MRSIFLSLILLILYSIGFSQYTVLLTNGEKIQVPDYRYNDFGSAIIWKTTLQETREIDLELIFSISDAAGGEEILYKPDTSKEDFMNVEQMKAFVQGESDAREKYKCKWCFVTGALIGAASPFVTPLIGIKPILYSPLLPAAASSGIGFTGASRKRIAQHNPDMVSNEHYILGYREVSSQKRLKSTIIGSGIGLAIGVIATIFFNLQPEAPSFGYTTIK